MPAPAISILLPVYNGEAFLAEAIQSLLAQTEQDFELLILDDGSQDKSLDIARSFTDVRIKLVLNEKNIGLPATLNKGIKLAKGTYLARMDADDISLPDRLEKQKRFLDQHPEIDLIGTQAEQINPEGKPLRRLHLPLTQNTIKWRALKANPFIHPSVMARRQVFVENTYNEGYRNSQDFELWSRLVFQKNIGAANLPECLLKLRQHPKSVTRTKSIEGKQRSALIPIHNRQNYLDLSPSDIELLLKLHLNQKLRWQEIKTIRNIDERSKQAFINKEKLNAEDLAFINAHERQSKWFLMKYWLKHLLSNPDSATPAPSK